MCLYNCIIICIFVYIQKDWALKGLVSETMSLNYIKYFNNGYGIFRNIIGNIIFGSIFQKY